MMRVRVRVGVLVVVAALALGACSGGSSDDASGSTPNSADANSGEKTSSDAACKLVTQADATKLFGVEATEAENGSPGNEASVCMWQADDAENHGFLLQVRVYNDEAHYGGAIFPSAEEIPGLGDKAFVNKGDGIAGADVQFVKDGKTYSVNYGITNVMAEKKLSAADQADELVAIVKANSSNV